MNKSIISSYLAIIGAIIFWGISYLSSKVILDVLHPMTLAFSRFFIASILLFFILHFKESHINIEKKDLPRMILAGYIGVALYFTFENNGIKLTNASTASMIIATIPIFAMLGDIIILKAPFTKNKLLSVILSLLGVFLIVSGGFESSLQNSQKLGCLFMFMAAICWTSFNFIAKPLYTRYSTLKITFYQTLFGTLALSPFAFIYPPETIQIIFEPKIILNIIYLATFCSAIGYFLYMHALKNLSVTITTLFVNFIPVVTVISSYFILKESITPLQILGGAFIIFSVYSISRKNNR